MISLPPLRSLEIQLEQSRQKILRLPGGEDLYQDVCLKCIRSQNKRDWNTPQYGYIRRVAKTTSIDRHRRQKIRDPFWRQEDHAESISDRGETLVSILNSERVLTVREKVAGLAEPYRSTLTARYFDEMSPTEISQRDRIPLNTVHTRLKRAIWILRADRELIQLMSQPMPP